MKINLEYIIVTLFFIIFINFYTESDSYTRGFLTILTVYVMNSIRIIYFKIEKLENKNRNSDA